MNILDRPEHRPVFTEEERLLLDSVAALAREKIMPRAEHYDRSAEFPQDNIDDMNALGLNAVFIPEAYGGAGMSYSTYLAVLMEISKACAATGSIFCTNFHAIRPVIDHGSEELKQKVLPRVAAGALASLCITESTSGSDSTTMTTSFRPEGDEIVVTGQKIFITNGSVADYYLVFGKWAGITNPKEAISVLILEKGTPGLSVLRLEDKMGMRCSPTAVLAFDNCRVPRANLIMNPGDGLKLLFAALNCSRPSVAAHALSIGRAAFEDAVAYINERKQFQRRIIEFQGIQFMVADLACEFALCEQWLWHVAGLVDRGIMNIGIEASMLKLRASDLAMKATTDAVQLFGGYGFCKDYRVERLMRDAKISQIWEGTNQIHRQLIGRSFMEKGK